MDANTGSDFRHNLAYACSHEKSVSRMCRELGLNRQQFDRYLKGRSRPSAFNARLIAQRFGLQAADLDLPHEAFVRRFDQGHTITTSLREPQFPEQFRNSFTRSEPSINRYVGYYEAHLNFSTLPGHILRYLILIGHHGPWYRVRSLVRYRDPDTGVRCLIKTTGVATMQADRLFVMERSDLDPKELTALIIVPSYRSNSSFLTGMCLDTPMHGLLTATASPLVLRYLGRLPDLRTAIGRCGLFPENARDLDPRVLRIMDMEAGTPHRFLRAPVVP